MKQTAGAASQPDTHGGPVHYRLRLFVADDEPNSVRARSLLLRVCESRLCGCHDLTLVDVFVDYQAAIDHRILMVPTLIVEAPLPQRVIVGAFKDEATLLGALGLSEVGERS
jgi:circadian clock protein KaiB